MSVTATIDLDEVRGALTTRAVLEYYGWTAKRSGDELEASACPARADHSRRALVINANSGRWRCFPCAASGDLFDFIAGVERLSIRNDFPAVLSKAAEIAGVGPSDLAEEERARRKADRKREREEREKADRAARETRNAAAIPNATSYWQALPTAHDRGLAYLAERGVADVLEHAEVRFDPRHGGGPALALRTSTGQIRNVVRRRPPELGEPKTPGLPECPTAGTLIGSVHLIEVVGTRDVVITEGVFDTITATLAWPNAIVLGAHGALNIPKVAQLAAPAVARAGRKLMLVPHEDRVGHDAALEAVGHAHRAGLSVLDGTLRIVKCGAKDLNDAWTQGWRPAA